ncbi:MAG: hypothetical protein JO122_02350 [Acetobacteraceae bacterium]|nr:hypothetical protein [Acetobacteraceae bacterium]
MLRAVCPSAAVAAALLAITSMNPAKAQNADFDLKNLSGWTISYINVREYGESRWGPDLLGREVLANGETEHITFGRGSACHWDINVQYQNRIWYYWTNVNLREINTMTIYYNETARNIEASWE